VFIEEGTTFADTGWTCTTNGVITIDTTVTAWTQFSGAGQILAGTGLTKAGNSLDVGAGNGITVNADTIEVRPDPAGNITVTGAGVAVTAGVFVQLTKLVTLSPQAVTGTVNGTNVIFQLQAPPVAGTVCVFLNGQLQQPGTDYSISGVTITFVAPPQSTGAADWVSATFISA
jgi:hypothetical protein